MSSSEKEALGRLLSSCPLIQCNVLGAFDRTANDAWGLNEKESTNEKKMNSAKNKSLILVLIAKQWSARLDMVLSCAWERCHRPPHSSSRHRPHLCGMDGWGLFPSETGLLRMKRHWLPLVYLVYACVRATFRPFKQLLFPRLKLTTVLRMT